jgi:prepilin-type N-terminal cleavage/methylation domain-containing protein
MKTVIYALLEIITAIAIIGIFATAYVLMASSPT